MPTNHYHKIVRDKVPETIEKNGGKVTFRTMPVDDFARLMRQKLVEEAQEVVGAASLDALVDELADVAEVLATIHHVLGIPQEAIDAARKRKNEERGGFEKRIFLESVEE